jgi:rod shape-determining protein MreD
MLVMLQSAIVSRMPLLHGTADLVLLALLAWAVHERVETAWTWAVIGGLILTIASALPAGVYLSGYLLAVGVALLMKRLLWQVPLLAMLAAVFLGTLFTQIIAVFTLNFIGELIPWQQSFNLIILPSLLLNLLLTIPVYGLITDLANWVYPEEIEI